MKNVISNRDCRISNKEFDYSFKSGIPQEVEENHINTLLDTELIELTDKIPVKVVEEVEEEVEMVKEKEELEESE